MSKFTKLVRSPGVFFRDLLMKRYPLKVNQRVPVSASPEEKDVRKWDIIDERIILRNGLNVAFPIDAVITYVDSRDPAFIGELAKYKHDIDADLPAVAHDRARFDYHNEILYCIRSIFKYAPWINMIYVVSASQKPEWFDESCKKVKFVNHEEILDKRYLPTFNSHVIESALHKIPGLSEHYIYFNDDMFLSRPVVPEYFFAASGDAFFFNSTVTLANSPISKEYDTPTEWGAKNARALLFDRYGFYVSQMFSHTVYPQLRSVAELCESEFAGVFEEFRQNRFRKTNDLLCTGFLYPYLGTLKGKGNLTRTRVTYFNIRMSGSRQNYHWLASVKGTDRAPFTFCANDRYSEDGEGFQDYEKYFSEFMEFYFPEKSSAEL